MPKFLKKVVFVLLALVIFIGLAALLRPSIKSPALPAPITLPSGETLLLRGVTYGTNHLAPGGMRWLRLLPMPVRQRVASLFTKTTPLFFDRTTTKPMLLLWIEAIKPQTTNNPASSQQAWAILADEYGQAAGGREWLSLYSSASNFGNVVEFKVFPRRSRQLHVQFVQGAYDKPVVIGEWKIPNPAPASAPPWRAAPLPQSRLDGDLECSLREVVTSVGSSSGIVGAKGGSKAQYVPAKSGEEVQATMPVSFRERGVSTNTWEIGDLTLADASGNLVDASSKSWSTLGNTVFFKWSPALWPSEPWELRLAAKRNAGASFLPSELMEFKDVRLGSLDSPAPLQVEKRFHGVSILLTGFTRRKPIDTNRGWSSDQASELKLTLHGLTNGFYLDLIKAVDDAGKAHKVVGSGGSSDPTTGGRDWHYNFSDIPLEARSLTFTFAVQRPRNFTFRIQPIVATNQITLPSE